MPQTLYWILFLIGAFVTMFVIVPPKTGPRLSYVGFWMGLLQAVFWLYLGQTYFQLFRIVGDPTVFGVPVITTLSWIPAAILFAYYFRIADTHAKKILLILVFAAGATVAQHMFALVNMWESINWNPGYTFILATITHVIMTVFLLKTRSRLM